MDNSFVPVKLFSLALVLSITTLQLKEHPSAPEPEPFKLTSRFIDTLQVIKTYLSFTFLYLFKPFPTILLLSHLASRPSPLSLLLLIGLLSAITRLHDSHWWSQHSYRLIGNLATYALIIIYTAQVVMEAVVVNDAPNVKDAIRWGLGVQGKLEVWDMEVISWFLIIGACSIQKVLEISGRKFENCITLEDLDQALTSGDVIRHS
jgi:hypothetical protein